MHICALRTSPSHNHFNPKPYDPLKTNSYYLETTLVTTNETLRLGNHIFEQPAILNRVQFVLHRPRSGQEHTTDYKPQYLFAEKGIKKLALLCCRFAVTPFWTNIRRIIKAAEWRGCCYEYPKGKDDPRLKFN